MTFYIKTFKILIKGEKKLEEEFEDLSVDACRKKFMDMRKSFQKTFQKADFLAKQETFNSLYDNICIDAVEGDVIAQDFLAYLNKKGWGDFLPVNMDASMRWQILAAANGNGFAIEKLTIFLSFAIDKILAVEDIREIAERNDIFQENYQYIIGRLICEGIVDELHINARDMIKEETKHQEASPKIMHVFDNAREESIPRVLKFLRS